MASGSGRDGGASIAFLQHFIPGKTATVPEDLMPLNG